MSVQTHIDMLLDKEHLEDLQAPVRRKASRSNLQNRRRRKGTIPNSAILFTELGLESNDDEPLEGIHRLHAIR